MSRFWLTFRSAGRLLGVQIGRDKRLGDLAYPLYVIHVPVAMLASAVALPGGAYARVVIAWAAALALLRAVDIPLERLRQRFVRGAMRRPAAPATLLDQPQMGGA